MKLVRFVHAQCLVGKKLTDNCRFLMKCQNETVTVELKNGTILLWLLVLICSALAGIHPCRACASTLRPRLPIELARKDSTFALMSFLLSSHAKSQLGTIVNGTIASVSPLMNVALRTVKYTAKNRDTLTLDTMTVRGSTVRYIILPDSLPLDTLLIDDAPKPKNKARKEADRGGRGGGRGGPRGRGGRGGRGRGRGRGM